LLCAWAEVGLRLTRLGEDWDVGALQARAERALDALTVERRHRDYPDEGYPVRPPDPRPGVRRVVALGSSSTGGAFQMDDLGLFWPARLGERLGPRGWEVVNQGVGGWNSLHVRLYLEQQVDALAPDLVVVYLGHNDLEPSALTARQSWERYRDRRAWTLALARSRAFTGLRLTLQALVGREGTCAVPPADARENLAAIVRAANDRGARVLLVTEGLDPDPAPMAGYGALMRDLAAGTGNRWLDGAGALHALGSPDLFIDDCHLSAQGHEVLAGLVEAALDEAGWLGPAGGAP
jgi:lysophospholipase L1-like esterase